jgi:fermentation-respiration switch protein FrsA (DUF1100 family)
MIFLFGLLLVFLFAGYYFALQVIHPKVLSVEETYRTEIACGRMNETEFTGWESRPIWLKSPFGYSLYGLYLPVTGSQKTIIIAHGITYSLYGSVKYVNLFRKRGFNVLLYDHRNHGRSGGLWSTFGHYEKHDLGVFFAWAQNQLVDGGQVAVMGESFGAAVAVQFAAIQPKVAFLVLDCCFSDLIDLLAYRLKVDFYLPPWPLLPLVSFFSRLLTGMSFGEICPRREMLKITCPVFFAHGQNDVFTPCRMSQELYEAAQSPHKIIYLAPNAGHAEAFWNNQKEYDRQVGEFLKK